MTFEQSLAALFVVLWVSILIGWAIKDLCFKPGP